MSRVLPLVKDLRTCTWEASSALFSRSTGKPAIVYYGATGRRRNCSPPLEDVANLEGRENQSPHLAAYTGRRRSFLRLLSGGCFLVLLHCLRLCFFPSLYRTARLPEDVCSLLLFSLESIVWCLQEVSDVGSMGWSSHVGCASAPRAFIPANIEEEQHGNSAVSSSSSSPVAQGISNQLRAASGRPDQQNAMLSDASSVDPREKGEGGREEDDLLEEVGDAAGQRRRRREDDDEEEKRRRKGREQVLLTLFGITKQSLAGAFGACGLLLNEMSPKDRRRSKLGRRRRGTTSGGERVSLFCFVLAGIHSYRLRFSAPF